ncbi:PepSY domain-containing protein [Pseudohoeflea suaedae]|uniref:PepSY domain-containing protein n=1 Tax=Pseudohoeflea suaedae TaxID=877384 RepID=A0A4R5PPF9_9HYPH|nr:PepSY domain-containing protein [Pseudohoeflea suaedae]TDH38753.1 PepSY domain-containing protein [Pseudohoeflea suaedae]
MSDISGDFSVSDAGGKTKASTSRFYAAAWRWHFYAGLFVAPFLVMLAVTGLMMLYSSVLSGRDGEKIHVVPAAPEISVAAQEASVRAAHPGGSLVEWIGNRTDDTVSVFRIAEDGAQIMVAVDPYTGLIVQEWPRRDSLYDFAETIHGTLMAGTLGDRLIETAAGFAIVLTITGVYLAWPRKSRRTPARPSPREKWKRWHRVIGLCAAPLLVAFLLSGHSWTGIWGEKFVQAWSTFPAEKWDDIPLSDVTHASLNHDGIKHVPWAIEQTPMPASGSAAGRAGLAEGVEPSLSSLVALGRKLGFSKRFHVNYPSGETGVWTLSQDSMSNDNADPTSDRTVHVDRYTGKILADIRYQDYSVPGKALAVGIALHEGDMGVINIAVNTLFCLSIVVLAGTGFVMWWKRRPSGGFRLAAPPVPSNMPEWRAATIVMLFTAMLFPLVGLTLLAVLILDSLVISRLPALRRAVN